MKPPNYPVAGSALLRAESVKSLKRDWSRSRLNSKPSPPREVIVVEEPDFDPEDKSEAPSPSAEEILAPALSKACVFDGYFQ